MVARQEGWKQKTQEALPAWTPGVAAVCRDNGTSSTSSSQFTLGKPHSKPHQKPGPGRVATRGQERLDTGHNSVLHHFHRCPVPLPNPNFPPSALNTDTDLTVVALKVIITVHRDHPHNVLTALKHVEPHGGEGGECSIVSPKSPSHPQKPSRSNRQILQRPLCSQTQSHVALRCFSSSYQNATPNHSTAPGQEPPCFQLSLQIGAGPSLLLTRVEKQGKRGGVGKDMAGHKSV